MDVKHGNREKQTPGHGSDPTPDLTPSPGRPFANDVIAPVNGFEKRLEMSR
jgi:hypothetical protein